MPLAILVGGIQAETEAIDNVRCKILFFKLAKFLNFIQKFSDEVGAIFIFPKRTMETKVSHYSTLLYSTINYLIFKDNREDMERVIKYYKTYSNILSFVDDIENLPEYQTFESACNQERYLFSWDSVPGDDVDGLLRFLVDDLDIDWAENAKIHKSDDGKTIRIFKDENSAEIKIDEEKEEATLKISDGRPHGLKVKKENGKLNIYQESIISKLSKYSRELRESIYEGVTEEYKVWYKIEFCKNKVKTTYDANFNTEKEDIDKEYIVLSNKK